LTASPSADSSAVELGELLGGDALQALAVVFDDFLEALKVSLGAGVELGDLVRELILGQDIKRQRPEDGPEGLGHDHFDSIIINLDELQRLALDVEQIPESRVHFGVEMEIIRGEEHVIGGEAARPIGPAHAAPQVQRELSLVIGDLPGDGQARRGSIVIPAGLDERRVHQARNIRGACLLSDDRVKSLWPTDGADDDLAAGDARLGQAFRRTDDLGVLGDDPAPGGLRLDHCDIYLLSGKLNGLWAAAGKALNLKVQVLRLARRKPSLLRTQTLPLKDERDIFSNFACAGIVEIDVKRDRALPQNDTIRWEDF
jgi:hypothetical protein